MRILFVTPYPPSRVRVRSYGFVSQLARQHHVEVLALCTNKRERLDVSHLQRAGVSVTAIQEFPGLCYLRALSALPSRLPLQVAFGASSFLRAAIEDHLAVGAFDLLHVEFVRALGALPESLPIPAIWDAVDCISQLYAQAACYQATWQLKLIGAHEAHRMRAYELEQLSRFRHILVTSERDRQALLTIAREEEKQQTASAKISVLPHGIDQEYFQPYRGKREPETLIFSGRMSFHANIAGVFRLVKQILPLVWRQRPNVRLIVAGSDPPASVRALARDPRIKITGYRADLRLHIAQATLAVCPLPYAVGIQNKVLEAMALGTPVVASSFASAGLTVAAGDLLVADEPADFAAHILRLLDDQALWHTLAERGIAYITAYHNWDLIIKQLTTIYSNTILANEEISK